MLSTACFALLLRSGPGFDLGSDPRLQRHTSLHESIVSLADLSSELSRETGVPLFVKRRVADRKVTIVFRDRPAAEAMERLATCMLMSWQKTSDGYELDLTGPAASAEARTEALEREHARSGLRDAVKEVRRLSGLPAEGKVAEIERLGKEFRDRLKAGESPESLPMLKLGNMVSAVHSAGFLEVVGPALSSARLDRDGIPMDTMWFSSADPADPVGHLDPQSIPTRNPGGYTDAIGIVTFEEGSHEIQSRLYAVSQRDGQIRTSAGGLMIPTSSSNERTELEKMMSTWSRPPSPDLGSKPITGPKATPATSEFGSGMVGRAQHLVDFADRSGVSIVADAFRRSLSKPMWLPGKTVQDWLDSYAKVCKAPWKGRPDTLREEKGWLMFREDHWWWRLEPEIPESVLRPLEEKAVRGHSPLGLEDYLRLATLLTPAQTKGLERQDDVLLRFPIGSLASAAFSMRLFGLCDPDARSRALSRVGLDLASCSPEVQSLAHGALLQLAVDSQDMAFIRALWRSQGVLAGFRFYAEDQIAKATDPTKIGDGREINIEFSYGISYQNSPHMQTFSCAKGAH